MEIRREIRQHMETGAGGERLKGEMKITDFQSFANTVALVSCAVFALC